MDEHGKGRSSDWELGNLDEIISRRYNPRQTTFFATNYRDPLVEGEGANGPGRGPHARGLSDPLRRVTLEDRVGPRVYSRLKEMCTLLQVGGPDYRQRGR